jgi:hypothetical protein
MSTHAGYHSVSFGVTALSGVIEVGIEPLAKPEEQLNLADQLIVKRVRPGSA